MELVNNAILNNHAGIDQIFKAYGINKPATLENVAIAMKEKGLPFIADVNDLIVEPYADFILSSSDGELDSFLGSDDFVDFGKIRSKIKARKADKPDKEPRTRKLQQRRETRGSRPNERGTFKERRQEKKDDRTIRREQKQIQKAQAKDYKTANAGDKRKYVTGAVLEGVTETAPDLVDQLITGDLNPISAVASVMSGVDAGKDFYDDAVQNGDDYDYDDSYESGGGFFKSKDGGKLRDNKTVMYIIIAIAVVLALGLLIYLTGKTGRK